MGNQQNNKILPSKKNFILGIIDLQYDFFKEGSLPVTDAELIVAPINKLRYIFSNVMDTFLSLDYHPSNHMSFCETHGKKSFTKEKLTLKMDDNTTIEVEQDMWPTHCVAGTHGANLHTDLILSEDDIYIRKGTKQNVESYSAFGDEYRNKYENTNLHKILKDKSITDIVLTGLATDYCVYYTGLDAIRFGYKVHLILSCTRGVKEETTKKALYDLKQKGVLLYKNIEEFYTYYHSVKN